MHTKTLRKLALALTFWLALHYSALRAQTFTAPLQASTTGTNPVDFEFRADGLLVLKGNIGVGTLQSGDLGAGPRMIWNPALCSFLAGECRVGNSEWADTGSFAFNFGYDCEASGSYSSASGYYAFATGMCSWALGNNARASGAYSTASGYYSTASGASASASGSETTASGNYSLAHGEDASATGMGAIALGMNVSANSRASFAVGQFNVGASTASVSSWTPTDPLFEVGNGNGGNSSNFFTPILSDAFVVYKNGNVAADGTIRCKPGGDVSMGSFTAGTAP